MENASPSTPALEVFFDGACPFCAREVSLLRCLDLRDRILFTDIAGSGFSPERAGVPLETLMARIHARLADGTLVDGVEVFRRIHDLLGFGPLVAVTRLPGLSHLLDAGYAWFARNRMRLAGRCEDGRCGLPGEPQPRKTNRMESQTPTTTKTAPVTRLAQPSNVPTRFIAAPSAFVPPVATKARRTTGSAVPRP